MITGPNILFGLYGTGGCGRSIMPFAENIVREKFGAAQVAFVETTPIEREVNGFPVLSEDEFFAFDAPQKYFNVGIANSKAREILTQKALAEGCIPLSLIAPDVVIYDNNEIGEGSIFCARTTVTTNVKIGKYFHANLYSYVEHDCIIGDYVTFAPRVNCNGNVHIGDHAYIGTGAILRQGTPGAPLIIGEGAVIGMGAVVTKNVPAFTTVVGNPARPLTEEA